MGQGFLQLNPILQHNILPQPGLDWKVANFTALNLNNYQMHLKNNHMNNNRVSSVMSLTTKLRNVEVDKVLKEAILGDNVSHQITKESPW